VKESSEPVRFHSHSRCSGKNLCTRRLKVMESIRDASIITFKRYESAVEKKTLVENGNIC
jgi:hypothetical protein